ncbi:MAG: pyruvate:ferredoxin (flavodoxin) oxidoreductase [Parachlamydiales bacterium]|nr:pyruvate:ferredoxin (flavodoxin) oxidoreductase [Parachlamydiales bacterium]
MKKNYKTLDGNSAAAHVAYAFSEICALYPITPSSTMGELIDEWSSQDRKNLFGTTVQVMEMQSEAGAAGTLHGALLGGAFASTFTASQGLLLMIPNMYKIAGELLPTVFHVSARALAGHALCIFGDHQDVMAARSTGFCQIASGSVQEIMDLALVAHLATLRASLPFLHFFDGFRTSHEIQKIEVISYEQMASLLDRKSIERHRALSLNPSAPKIRGTAQNPDVYFQSLEAANRFYLDVPAIVEEEMEKISGLTGRSYHLFDYEGPGDATDCIVIMGSATQTVEETIRYLQKKNQKIGLLKVRLFRPFSAEHFLRVLPKSVQRIAVLDRTKEGGALGQPLYLDVLAAVNTSSHKRTVVGGRYGLGQKEFTPSMVQAVLDNLLQKEPKNNFSVGIEDDVTFSSLPMDQCLLTCQQCVQCKFYGLGGDGTVGANKEAIKIIGDYTEKYVQGYFSYDSKKSSGLTVSHLRFSEQPILSSYLIQEPDYVACHHPSFISKIDLLEGMKKGGVFLLNAPWNREEIERVFPDNLKREIAEKEVSLFLIDATGLAKELGLGGRINTIMQAVFFFLVPIIPFEEAMVLLQKSVEKAYGKKGTAIVDMNKKAIQKAIEYVHQIECPAHWASLNVSEEKISDSSDFIKNVACTVNMGKGDTLPVSAFSPGGIFMTATTKYEKRAIATQLPEWIADKCIQCNQCAFVCPHAAIRPVLQKQEELSSDYPTLPAMGKGMEDYRYSIAIDPYDCTGCGNCVAVCPAAKGKALELKSAEEVFSKEKKFWDHAATLPVRSEFMNKFSVKGSQFRQPFLEFSGACAGCGETPYVKLITQLFGPRVVIANATGCSSIWGGSFPSFPWAVNTKGEGPAWANSLFEDNAEFGLGMHLAMQFRKNELKTFVQKTIAEENDMSFKELLERWMNTHDDKEANTLVADEIMKFLDHHQDRYHDMQDRKDLFYPSSLWILGGDGWAYDIGFGGLDHVLSLQEKSNILVLDTELYSNTGGQASKATPKGAVAKFAASGKKGAKKDLAYMAMSYGHAYVAQIALLGDMQQTVRTLKEAESFPGPSLVIAYAPCIAHGIKGGLEASIQEVKKALEVGYWINFRYDPRNEKPLVIDSKEPTFALEEFLQKENRYNYLLRTQPDKAQKLHDALKKDLQRRYFRLKNSSL